MGVPVTVAMGNAYHVFFVPMVIATGMPMPKVMGMPVTMCTGTSTIGKHASGAPKRAIPPETSPFGAPGGVFANSRRARAHSHRHAHDYSHGHARGYYHGHKKTHCIGMPMALVMGMPVATTMRTKKYVIGVPVPLVMGTPMAFIII